MKVECVGCKKAIDEQDFGSCHSVYKCRKEHVFACCRADCLRTFEKKCAKVAEFVRKTHNKLNNDGHTSALRRMPPGERDKYKQLNEAEANGLMICPEEIKAGDRCVPFCSHCVLRTGGSSIQEEEESSNALRREESETFKKEENTDNAMKELVTDDMLVELRRDEDSFLGSTANANNNNNNAAPAGKPTKTAGKGKKDQKGRQIDLKGLLGGAVLGQDPVPAATTGNPGPATTAAAATAANPWQRGTQAGLAAPAWGQTVARGLPGEDKGPGLQAAGGRKDPPPDAATLKRKLMELTACSEERAAEVLAQNGWNLDYAADALFQNVGTFAERAAAAAARNAEARPQQRAQAAKQQQRQPAAAAQTAAAQVAPAAQTSAAAQQVQAQPQAAVAQSNDDSSQGLPPPANPPPPRVPEGWQAVWCNVQKAYYFWNLATNETTWDNPEVSESDAPSEPEEPRPAEEAQPQPQPAEPQPQPQPQQQSKQSKKIAPSELSQSPSPKSNGVVQHEANEPRLDPVTVFLRRLNTSSTTSFTTAVPESTVGGCLEQPAVTPEDASPAGQAESTSGATSGGTPEGQYCCSRHWRPRDDLPECLRLVQGERLEVSWSEPSDDGWAYGFTLEDSAHPGYFPQAVLRAPMRQPVPRISGERITVSNSFDEPEYINGYLQVSAGEVVRVLHPTQEPHVWVFVERTVPGQQGRREAGWIPEDVLSDLPEKSH